MNPGGKLSVIVPVYNVEKYLRACAESILAQTHQNLELIMVDDGSTDNSLGVAAEIAGQDGRARVITQKNAGASSARNAGIAGAAGKYIAFVDSDDTIAPDMYERLIAAMEKDNLDFVMCGKRQVHEFQGKICEIDEASYQDSIWRDKDSFMRDFGELFSLLMIHSPCNKLYLAEVIRRENIIFPPDMVIGEDLVLNLNYIKSCEKIGFVDFMPYKYVIRSGSSSLMRTFRENAFQLKTGMWEAAQSFAKEYPHFDRNEPVLKKEFFKMANECAEDVSLAKNVKLRRKRGLCREVAEDLSARGILNSVDFTRRQEKLLRRLYRGRNLNTIILYFNLKNFIRQNCHGLFLRLR